MRKKKDEITIRSSAAEYLTYVASGGDQQDSVEMRYEEENTVSQADQKIQNTLWELEKSYDILDSACKKRSSEMAQLETDMVTKIHRYQICIVLFGVFSFISYWRNYPEGTIGGGMAGAVCLSAIGLMIFTGRHKKKKQVYFGELQREDHESMRKLQEQMTELREQSYFDKK